MHTFTENLALQASSFIRLVVELMDTVRGL
jgi:hypothetical protein